MNHEILFLPTVLERCRARSTLPLERLLFFQEVSCHFRVPHQVSSDKPHQWNNEVENQVHIQDDLHQSALHITIERVTCDHRRQTSTKTYYYLCGLHIVIISTVS